MLSGDCLFLVILAALMFFTYHMRHSQTQEGRSQPKAKVMKLRLWLLKLTLNALFSDDNCRNPSFLEKEKNLLNYNNNKGILNSNKQRLPTKEHRVFTISHRVKKKHINIWVPNVNFKDFSYQLFRMSLLNFFSSGAEYTIEPQVRFSWCRLWRVADMILAICMKSDHTLNVSGKIYI